MIRIENKLKGVVLSFPQNYKEITADVLTTLTNHIIPSTGKILLALVKDCDLCKLAIGVKTRKVPESGVIALIAKADKKWLEDNNTKIGDSVIITDSELERGVHVFVNSGASFNSLVDYIASHENDRSLMVTNKFKDADDNVVKNLCSLEFKMVNQYDIVGFIPIDSVLNDPFKSPISNN